MSTKTKECPLRHIELGHEQQPSWRTFGEGYAQLKATYHEKAGWVSVSIEESYAHEGGNTTSKYTSLTLTKAERKKLLKVIAPELDDLLRAAEAALTDLVCKDKSPICSTRTMLEAAVRRARR